MPEITWYDPEAGETAEDARPYRSPFNIEISDHPTVSYLASIAEEIAAQDDSANAYEGDGSMVVALIVYGQERRFSVERSTDPVYVATQVTDA